VKVTKLLQRIDDADRYHSHRPFPHRAAFAKHFKGSRMVNAGAIICVAVFYRPSTKMTTPVILNALLYMLRGGLA
jgi:hypothetical protein